MKKHYAKRKKVIIDALDGKIINEPIALKIENIPEYLEKNGLKIVKIILLFLLNLSIITSVKAIDIIDLGLAGAPTYKIAFTLNLLLFVLILSVLGIIIGYKINNFYVIALSGIIMLFLGIMLLANGFNVLLGIFTVFIALISIWMAA